MLLFVSRTMHEVLSLKMCSILTDIWSKILFKILFKKYIRPFTGQLKNSMQAFTFYFYFFGLPHLVGKGYMKLPLSVCH